MVHFRTFENFLKIKGEGWAPRTLIFVANVDELVHIAVKHFFRKKKSNSQVILKSHIDYMI